MALDMAAIEERVYHRRLEEICEMQDRAIAALKEALAALERNRNEQGYQQQLQWQQYKYPYYQIPQPQQPYLVTYPDGGLQWGGQLNQITNSASQPSSQKNYAYAEQKPIVVDWNVEKDYNAGQANSSI